MKEYKKAEIDVVKLDTDVILTSGDDVLTTTWAATTNSSEIPDSDSTIEQ